MGARVLPAWLRNKICAGEPLTRKDYERFKKERESDHVGLHFGIVIAIAIVLIITFVVACFAG